MDSPPAQVITVPANPFGKVTTEAFLTNMLVPGPVAGSLLPCSDADRHSATAYDAALAVLWLLSRGQRDAAGQVLQAMAAVQAADGTIAFSFPLPAPPGGPVYVRSGALAWVGYAAVRYLDDSPAGAGRPAIAAMAQRLATYLLAHRVDKPGDPRNGLVTGGSGRYVYSLDATDHVRESFVPGEIAWVSTEHNIDTWFFLQALGASTADAQYKTAANNLGQALLDRLWSERAGQFAQGAGADGPDFTEALDCASWGALFLAARGDRVRALRAYNTAEQRYASIDPATLVTGHRPYADAPVIENRVLAQHFRAEFPNNLWNTQPAIWPEGSAGVALAALRLGKPERAKRIVEQLDGLRTRAGGLPGLTVAVPLEFSTTPAFAGTAWVELVRAELGAAPGSVGIWSEEKSK